MEKKGHVLVKLLVSLISVSAISTAFLNVHLNARQQVYYEDLSSLMSMQARSAFDRLSYHLRLAGYANSEYKKPVEIVKGTESDTLKIWHNDVEIVFYLDHEKSDNALYEKVDGSARKVIEGVKSLKLAQSNFDLISIELTLSQTDTDESSKIVSRSYSTSIKL